jgi:hypothetical protein
MSLFSAARVSAVIVKVVLLVSALSGCNTFTRSLALTDEEYQRAAINAYASAATYVSLAASVTPYHSEIDPNPSPAPLTPSTPDGQCSNCRGTGQLGDGRTAITCPKCKGTGKVVSNLSTPSGNIPIRLAVLKEDDHNPQYENPYGISVTGWEQYTDNVYPDPISSPQVCDVNDPSCRSCGSSGNTKPSASSGSERRLFSGRIRGRIRGFFQRLFGRR